MILKRLEHISDYCRLAKSQIGVFGTEEWLNIYENKLTVVGIYKDEKQLIGGFYYLEEKKFGLRFIKLPPYTPHCGLFFVSESKNPASRNGFAKEVISEVCCYLTSQRAAVAVFAFPLAIIDLQPFIWEDYKVIPNYTYRIDLLKPFEAIRADFDPKHRNAINKAVSEGVTLHANHHLPEELFKFFNASLLNANANVYPTELQHIFTRFARTSNSFSVTAQKAGEDLGTVFCVYDEHTCYYLLGGVKKESRVQGVNTILVQESISLAKERGCQVFDFEGSMLQGVEKFFRGFGGSLVPYFTANKALLPLEMALKFKKRERF